MNLRHCASLIVLLLGVPSALLTLRRLGNGPVAFEAPPLQMVLSFVLPLLPALLLYRWAEPAAEPHRPRTPAVLGGCLALGFLLVLPAMGLSWVSMQIAGVFGFEPAPERLLDALTARGPDGFTVSQRLGMVGACTLGPLTEELLYRGVLFRELARDGHVLRTALLTSFFFALLHVEPYLLLPLFGLSLVFTAIYRRYGLVASAVVHGAFNFTNLLLALRAQSL